MATSGIKKSFTKEVKRGNLFSAHVCSHYNYAMMNVCVSNDSMNPFAGTFC